MSSLPALTTLLKQTHIADDDQILRAANAALKLSKTDLEAQHVKLVALLKLDRYDDALKTLETGGAPLKEMASLEHAYALYKAGHPTAAAQIARQGGEQRAYQHVEAQACYRMEKFERAAEVYGSLAKELERDAEADLRINAGAVEAQLEWAGRGRLVSKKKPAREDLEAFETAYNAACGSLARGELGQGEVLLRRARDLCDSLEDLSEGEKRAELLPIAVQQVYVWTRLGRVEEAEALARDIDATAIPDASTQHIAQVNRISASTAAPNPFLTQRLLSRDLVESLKPDYPFAFQSTILQRNAYASDLQTLKFRGTASSTTTILSKHPAPNLDAFSNTLSVVNAAAHAKGYVGKEALKLILPVLERRPADVGLILTLTQLYVLTSNHASAITLMETFLARLRKSASDSEQDIRFAPGLVSALVSLYAHQGRKDHARTELANAAAYWRRKPKERSAGVVHLLKAAGGFLLASQEAEHTLLARGIFAELHARDPSDRYAAAGALATSPADAEGADLETLTPIARLLAGIDADALEGGGIARRTPPTTTTRKRPAAEDAATATTKPKRIRANRLPKDFDPERPPDPERWLPLRDRSSYRPKGKKGKAKQAGVSQGAVGGEGGREGGGRPVVGGEVVKAKQTGGGGGGAGAGKKKKRGGKW